MKSNQVIKCVAGDGVLTFVVKDAGELVFDLANVSEANLQYAALHGFKQRISDAAAIPCDPETGKPATPQEKFEAMARLVAHYESGAAEWSPARTEGGGGGRANYLAEALAEVKGLDVETVKAFLKERTPKQKAALAEVPEVKAIIDGKKKRVAAGVDAGELIEQLMQPGRPSVSL